MIVKGKSLFTSKIATKQYPYLDKNITTDVLIIGGGATGLLALWYFHKQGIPCVLIDKGRFGYSSTSITTALLQYELDDNYEELVKVLSPKDVKGAYMIGVHALKELEEIINTLGNQCGYEKNDCLLMTNKISEIQQIKREYDYRMKMKLPVTYLEESHNAYPFPLKAGVLAQKGGARLNPYAFTHQILEYANQKNIPIYENTRAVSSKFDRYGVSIFTQCQNVIRAKTVVLATGYEAPAFCNRQFFTPYVTYNIVTKPIPDLPDLKLLLRDNQKKYHYFRQTSDQRIILGGEDVRFPTLAFNKSIAKMKYHKLLQYLKEMFPHLSEQMLIDYNYCGVFGTTKDNLGVVGFDEKQERLLYCLGYGANGILFAIMGAKMLAQNYVGKPQQQLDLFNPSRKTL